MSTPTKWIIGIIVLALIVWGVIAANKKQIDENAEPIKIGAAISLSGDAASFGEFAKKGIDLAVQEINTSGGIDGRPVEVIFEDDQTDPKVALSAFQKLVSVDGVDAVIGGLFDFVLQPLLPVALTSDVALVSPSNFRIEGALDLNENSFVMLSDFYKVVEKLQVVLDDSAVQNVAVVRFQSEFGKEIYEVVDRVTQELGKPAVVDKVYAQIGGNDFRTTILELKEAQVDTVFLDMLDQDIIAFLTRARELNYNPRVMGYNLVIDAFNNPTVDKTLFENAIVLNWEISTSDFAEKFFTTYGVESGKSADKAYAAIYVLAEAIAKTQSTGAVPEYMESTTFKTPVGSVVFTKDHAAETTAVKIQQIKNGKLVEYSN